MGFYDLSKQDRNDRVTFITNAISSDLKNSSYSQIVKYFSDEDTYIRKAAYLAIGKLYKHVDLKLKIIGTLELLFTKEDFRIRQTIINAAGEIGITSFEAVSSFFDRGLFDHHHSVRNAVIGSIKKMGEKNPEPVFNWCLKYLHHPEKEIRREICHGIELRGRKYPQDILPMLKELEHDKTPRVRKTLIHVLGQISYKKGCIQTVIKHLESWENNDLVDKALMEIIDVHERYKDFAVLTQEQAREYINANFIRNKINGNS